MYGSEASGVARFVGVSVASFCNPMLCNPILTGDLAYDPTECSAITLDWAGQTRRSTASSLSVCSGLPTDTRM